MAYDPPNPNGQATSANSAPVVIASDQSAIPVSGTITTNPSGTQTVVGNVASGTTDSGNPVKVGGKYNGAGITLTDGQRGDLQLDSSGRLEVNTAPLSASFDNVGISDGTNTANVSAVSGKNGLYITPNSATGSSAPSTAFYIAAVNNSGNLAGLSFDKQDARPAAGNEILETGSWLFNGSTWDRTRSAGGASGTTGTGVVASGAMGIYNTSAPTASNGDYYPLQLDSSGNLKVNIASGSSSGTQYAELATTTSATGTLTFGRYVSTLPTLTNNEMNEPMLDSSSRLLVNAPTATGSSAPANAFYIAAVNNSGNLAGLSFDKQDARPAAGNEILETGSWLFNGSTWDRTRSAGGASNTTGTGVVASGHLGQYNSSPSAITSTRYGVAQLDIKGEQLVSLGGATTTAVAAGTSANTVISANPGRLARVLVTATGTNAMNIYDNATTNSGTIIGAIPANPTVGTTYDFGMPAANGITVGGNASNPGVTISWI